MNLPCMHCGDDVELVDGAAPDRCPSCSGDLLVFERFRPLALAGSGGMSTVYRARDEETGDVVAIKVLSLAMAADADWKGHELFERGSRLLQELDHPQLPTIYDFGEDSSGQLVLVTELFEGGTLAERIEDGARFDPESFERFFRDAFGLLAYLQSRQPPVLHRDIKPSNLMFSYEDDWTPVLVDFDTVALPRGAGEGLTMVGTPEYSAPEQLMADATLASDVYSMGLTLIEALTHLGPKELPREGGKIAPGEALDGIDPDLRATLLACVEPELDRRPQDGQAVLDHLATLRRRRANAGRRRAVIAVVLATLIATCAGLWLNRRELGLAPLQANPVAVGTLSAHGAAISRIDFGPRGQRLVSADTKGRIILWDIGKKTPVAETNLEGVNGLGVVALRLAPDAQHIAAGTSWLGRGVHGDVLVLQPKGKELTQLWSDKFEKTFAGDFVFIGPELVFDWGQYLMRRDLKTGDKRGFYGKKGVPAVSAFAFDPGFTDVYIARGSEIERWGFTSGKGPSSKPVASLKGHGERIRAMAINSDGSLLASADKEGRIIVWSTSDNSVVANEKGHKDKINALAFHPDGERLASGSHDLLVKIWEARTLRELAEIKEHKRKIYTLGFHPTEPLLATAGRDKVVRLWTID